MSPFRWIPNALSVFRFLLAVPVAVFLWRGDIGTALLVLALAGVTDLADGFLAREFHWRSKLGAWLDPAADKMLISTCLVTLTWKGDIPLWFCVLTMGRDILLVSGVFALVARGTNVRIQPHLSGKLATVAQNVAILLAILQRLSPAVARTLPYAFAGSLALTVISSVVYGRVLARLLQKEKEQGLSGSFSP